MIQYHTDRYIQIHGDVIFDYIKSSWISRVIAYVINSETRKAVVMTKWLREGMNELNQDFIAFADSISDKEDHEEQMEEILKKVRANFKYIGDKLGHWKMPEYWQTPNESVKLMEGDCEDGAILMYALAIYKKIPENRLMIFAGNVQSSSTAPIGGHAWLGFKPTNYPHNWVFMDWCYYPSKDPINKRLKYDILDKLIECYKTISPTENEYKVSNYKSIWFGFTESIGISKF